MDNAIHFETPENVRIQYAPAGLGTRFLAWFVDQVLLWIVMFLAFIALACAGASVGGALDSLDEEFSDDFDTAVLYFMGLMAIIWGLGSFVYFGFSELFFRGQTLGKRLCRIRVVKSDGFALDPGSILVRNLFRVADHLPPLWVVPVLSQRGQRAGDMVAGTLVVSDDPQTLTSVRTELSERSAVEAEFRFDQAVLSRLRPADVDAIERILDRWDRVPENQRKTLLETIVEPLAVRLQVTPPPQEPEERRVRFLEDLLAAEFRRQNRALG